MKGKNILLVEEEKDSLLSISLILKFNGYGVSVARNFEQAGEKTDSSEKYTSWSCDLLITDFPLSRLSEMAMINNRSRTNKNSPVFVLVDFAYSKTKRELRNKNVYLLERPVDSKELLKLVNKTLENRKRRKR